MPAIMCMYRNARKDTFLYEVRNMLTGAESEFLSKAIKNNKIDVVASNRKASIGVCDNSQAHDSKCYIQCKSKQKLNLNEIYVVTATYNDITKTTASNAQNECYISADGVRYPQPLVPLTIGENPSSTGFDDAEWFSGEVYLARLYNGVLSQDEIQNNYYSNMMRAKRYTQNANAVSLNGGGPAGQIEKYQISIDEGNTREDYDPSNMPIIGHDSWV